MSTEHLGPEPPNPDSRNRQIDRPSMRAFSLFCGPVSGLAGFGLEIAFAGKSETEYEKKNRSLVWGDIVARVLSCDQCLRFCVTIYTKSV